MQSSGRLWRGLSALLSLVVLFVGGYALYLYAFGVEGSLIARLLEPNGHPVAGFVEIDSPEVYTRERLVNDRFVEDSWLRSLLASASANSIGPTLALRDATRRSGRIGQAPAAPTGEGGDTPDQQPETQGDATPPPAPEDASGAALDGILAFKAEQLYRQTIRQAIIENQLDDTHDLQGNSLYLFKFDASVLPTEPDNRVLRIEMELSNRADFNKPFKMADFIRRNEYRTDVLAEADRIYDLWLQGANAKLERLRSDLRQAFRRDTVGDDFSRDVKLEFRNRVGISLAGDALNPDSLRAALQGVSAEIMRRLNYARRVAAERASTDPTLSQRFAALGRSESECGVLDLISSTPAPPDEPVAAADTADPETPAPAPAVSEKTAAPSAETEAVLDEIGRCLTETVITNRAVRLSFSNTSASMGVNGAVWDYLTAVQRTDGVLGLGRRTDYYFVSHPALMQSCFEQEECLQALGGYQFVGLVDLKKPESQDVVQALAAIGDRADCSHMRPADDKLPDSILIYALSNQQIGAGLVPATRAEPLPPEALREILLANAFLCSPPAYELKGLHLNFERGLYNFIERLRERSRGYSYSVMPREDLQIVAREFDGEGSFGGSGGLLGVRGEISEERRRAARAVEGEATIVGFGAAQSVGPGGADPERASVQFGWIVWPGLHFDGQGAPTARQIPMQKSLSALVSIPAWWERVHICGRYEWLETRAADERQQRSESLRSECRGVDLKAEAKAQGAPAKAGASPAGTDAEAAPSDTLFEYDVSLPFEIDSLDPVLFRQTRLLAEPTIFEWAMGDIRLTICQPASIIISGQRLWRSAVVTVGSQVADEIVVLPNMEGIVARFKQVQFPDGAGTPTSAAPKPNIVGDLLATYNPLKPVVLTVWTSEGRVQYSRGVTLVKPPEVTSCAPAAAPAALPAPPQMAGGG